MRGCKNVADACVNAIGTEVPANAAFGWMHGDCRHGGKCFGAGAAGESQFPVSPTVTMGLLFFRLKWLWSRFFSDFQMLTCRQNVYLQDCSSNVPRWLFRLESAVQTHFVIAVALTCVLLTAEASAKEFFPRLESQRLLFWHCCCGGATVDTGLPQRFTTQIPGEGLNAPFTSDLRPTVRTKNTAAGPRLNPSFGSCVRLPFSSTHNSYLPGSDCYSALISRRHGELRDSLFLLPSRQVDGLVANCTLRPFNPGKRFEESRGPCILGQRSTRSRSSFIESLVPGMCFQSPAPPRRWLGPRSIRRASLAQVQTLSFASSASRCRDGLTNPALLRNALARGNAPRNIDRSGVLLGEIIPPRRKGFNEALRLLPKESFKSFSRRKQPSAICRSVSCPKTASSRLHMAVTDSEMSSSASTEMHPNPHKTNTSARVQSERSAETNRRAASYLGVEDGGFGVDRLWKARALRQLSTTDVEKAIVRTRLQLVRLQLASDAKNSDWKGGLKLKRRAKRLLAQLLTIRGERCASKAS